MNWNFRTQIIFIVIPKNVSSVSSDKYRIFKRIEVIIKSTFSTEYIQYQPTNKKRQKKQYIHYNNILFLLLFFIFSNFCTTITYIFCVLHKICYFCRQFFFASVIKLYYNLLQLATFSQSRTRTQVYCNNVFIIHFK